MKAHPVALVALILLGCGREPFRPEATGRNYEARVDSLVSIPPVRRYAAQGTPLAVRVSGIRTLFQCSQVTDVSIVAEPTQGALNWRSKAEAIWNGNYNCPLAGQKDSVLVWDIPTTSTPWLMLQGSSEGTVDSIRLVNPSAMIDSLVVFQPDSAGVDSLDGLTFRFQSAGAWLVAESLGGCDSLSHAAYSVSATSVLLVFSRYRAPGDISSCGLSYRDSIPAQEYATPDSLSLLFSGM